MSECSSSSTDADQPGEKLDLSVSGLMVLLYASGNENEGVCARWLVGAFSFFILRVCVSACARICEGMHTLMHIYVPGSITGIIYLT